MSVEAISWAFNLAPVPAGRGGQPSSACKFVLVGLANHSGPDGTGAFPSVATLVRYTGLSERTVRSCLDRLEACGVIRPCDPDIVAARIKRADRRPKGWDLDLTLVRDDLTDADVAVLERQSPGLAIRLGTGERPGPGGSLDGVQSPHLVSEPVDNPADGVQLSHPAEGSGCNERADGVQPAQPRGAAVAPEPYIEPSREPSAAPAPARETPGAACTAEVAGGGLGVPTYFNGGGPVGEFFDALGDAWRLTAAQRARLTPAITAALTNGWSASDLAAFTGANTNGIRNPYAVLNARISPRELPPPTGRQPARPAWCGECDRVTRMLDFDGDAPRPCQRCKPRIATNITARSGAVVMAALINKH